MDRFKFFRKFAEIFASPGAPPVSMTLAANIATRFASDVDTDGKFATGANRTGGKFATSMNNTKHGWQFGVNDTCGKFADGVNVISGKEQY